jgi:hypothetical protein
VQSPELVVELSRLLEMEVDAAQAAVKALAFLAPGPIRDEVLLIAREHEAHIAALRDHIEYRGYQVPQTSSAVRGILLGATVQPVKPEVEDVLRALRSNAHLACALYAKLLAKAPPEDAEGLVRRIRDEEARHLRWAERALASGTFAATSAAP